MSLKGSLSLSIFKMLNRIGGVMVSVLALSVVDCGFKPDLVKPKTIKMVFIASPLMSPIEEN